MFIPSFGKSHKNKENKMSLIGGTNAETDPSTIKNTHILQGKTTNTPDKGIIQGVNSGYNNDFRNIDLKVTPKNPLQCFFH